MTPAAAVRLSGAPSLFQRPTPIWSGVIDRTPGSAFLQPGEPASRVDHHHAVGRLAEQVGVAVAGHVTDAATGDPAEAAAQHGRPAELAVPVAAPQRQDAVGDGG